MIRILGQIPRDIIVACSGGVDSMAALSFLHRGKRDVIVAHFNHGTPQADKFQEVVEKFCLQNNITCIVGRIEGSREKSVSQEEFWRNERYRFFDDLSSRTNRKVITCHHLDDAVETWIWTSLHGNPKLIPHTRGQYIRPFLLTEKETLIDWCKRKEIPFVEDISNENIAIPRNRIRHNIVPEALHVNPGLKTTVRKKILNEAKINEKPT